MIPNAGHFIFGVGDQPASLRFTVVHYLAVASFVAVNRPDAVFVHVENEPRGNPWWDRAADLATVTPFRAPVAIGGQPLVHPAHRVDVARLEILSAHGGIYLDLDTICVRPFAPLLDRQCVLGIEKAGGRIAGLCNAVILAEQGAPFLARWLAGFDPARSLWEGFRSAGEDRYWNEYSVKYPAFLASEFGGEITVEPSPSFYRPSWDRHELDRFFRGPAPDTDDAYCHHLWQGESWNEYLAGVTSASIRAGTDWYSSLGRPYLPEE